MVTQSISVNYITGKLFELTSRIRENPAEFEHMNYTDALDMIMHEIGLPINAQMLIMGETPKYTNYQIESAETEIEPFAIIPCQLCRREVARELVKYRNNYYLLCQHCLDKVPHK